MAKQQRKSEPADDNEDGQLPEQEASDTRTAEALDALGEVLDKPAIHKAISAYKEKVAAQQEFAKLRLAAEKELKLAQLKFAASSRWFSVGSLALGLGILVGVMWMFKDREQVLIPIVTATIGIIGGASGARVLSGPRK